ncbi:hypothetical protein NC01_02695 [Streptococcus uberis]|nr:hypothetical protein NC01_02695 [Streptococcus uberis]
MKYGKFGISLVAASVLLLYTGTVRADDPLDYPSEVIQKGSDSLSESNLQTTHSQQSDLTDANQTTEREVSNHLEESPVASDSDKLGSIGDDLGSFEEKPSRQVQTKSKDYSDLPEAYKKEVTGIENSLLALNDPTKVKELQKETKNGLGTLVSVIDVGFDIYHSAFKLDKGTDSSKLAVQKEGFEKLKEKENIDYGQWINDKIVFAYDYSNQINILGPIDKSAINPKEIEHINHGTHVAGIVAANSEKIAYNNFFVNGMAPNAQLMLMRVSPLAKNTTNNKDKFAKAYANAIKDSVRLGAKTVNMSFGRSADSWLALHSDVKEAIQLAKEHGVLLVAAVGNDGAFGKGFDNPYSKNPDFGQISSPAISNDILSVGGYDSKKSVSQVASVNSDGKEWKLPLLSSKAFDKDKEYNIVFVNTGSEQDLVGQDLNGKIALIKRTGSVGLADFRPTLERLKKIGASGILVANNREHQSNMLIPYTDVPLGFISFVDGQKLVEANNSQIRFPHKFEVIDNAGGDRMMVESSWGLNAEGQIKPDIVAPGFEILSTISKDTYETLSGTSMSTPHVSGIMAMLQAQLANKYASLNLSPEKQLELTKHIVMSSARTLFNPEAKAYYSPRQQGAGAIDADKAFKAEYYLTSEDNQAKVNLGKVTDLLTFVVRIHNLKQTKSELYYQTNLLTDQVKEGKFALQSRSLKDSEWKKVTVSGPYTDLTLTIDASDYTEELLKQMPNGYFLDGFVRFKKGSQDSQELMSIPFLAYRGDFANLPALEDPIYSQMKDGTFYEKTVKDGLENQLDYESSIGGFGEEVKTKNNYTALVTQVTPWFLANVLKEGIDPFESAYSEELPKDIVLGTYAKSLDEEEHFTLDLDQDGKPYFAISPNGDNNFDYLTPQATFLRNVKTIYALVLNEKGEVVWKSDQVDTYSKNYAQAEGHHKMEKLVWNGKNQLGEKVKDGLYTYRILYTPVVEGALEQHKEFNVMVSTQTPDLPKSAHYDEKTGIVTVGQIDSKKLVPHYRTFIAFDYDQKGDSEMGDGMTYKFTKYFFANENGQIILPKEVTSDDNSVTALVSLDKLTLVVEDKAGNFNSILLTDLLNATKTKQTEQEKLQEDKKEEQQLEMDSNHANSSAHKPLQEFIADKKVNSPLEKMGRPLKELTDDKKEDTVNNLAQKPVKVLSNIKSNLPETGHKDRQFGVIVASILLVLVSLFWGNKKRKTSVTKDIK